MRPFTRWLRPRPGHGSKRSHDGSALDTVARMETFTFILGQRAWLVTLVLFAACFGAAELGFYLGRRRSRASDTPKKEHVSAVQAAVAAMLGLLLAFTVSMSVGRFEDRKAAVVDEANAIGTAYLRASLLPEPLRSQATGAFAEYVATRLQVARSDWFTVAGAAMRAEKDELQRQLWSIGVAAGELDQRAVTYGLYIAAVNEMIDSAGRRDAGLRNHLPESVLYVIFAVSIITVGVLGYASGLGGQRSLVAVVVISFVLAAIMFLILDFDRPYSGIIQVGQQSLLELKDSIIQGLPLP